MTSWDLEGDIALKDACAILRTYPDADVTAIPGGIGLDFGEHRVAWVGDGEPDFRTHIVIKDWSQSVAWDLFDYLAARTTTNMALSDQFGILVRERTWPDPSEHRISPTPVDWDRREVATRVVTEAIQGPVSADRIRALVRGSGVHEAPDARERSIDLAADLVRAGLIEPRDTGAASTKWPEQGETLVSRLYEAWPGDEQAETEVGVEVDAFWLAPSLMVMDAVRTTGITLAMVTEWMKEPID